jgi:DNA-binding IclR family transcriptional regulator
MTRRSPQTERLVETIEILAEAGKTGRSLTEVARHLDINKTTIYPMINELVKVGWIIRHPRTKLLQLGPRLSFIGKSAEEGFDIVDLVRPRALSLAQSLDATCMLMAARQNGIMVDSVISGSAEARVRSTAAGALGLRPGDAIPFRPPNAAVFVSWGSEETRSMWLERESWLQPNPSPEHKSQLLASIELIRQYGFAVHEFRPAPNTFGELVSAATGNIQASQRASILHEGSFTAQGDLHLLTEILPTEEYYPVAISAPIFDGDDQVTHAILVTDIETPATGEQVIEIGERVLETVRLIAHDSGRPNPAV